MNPHESNGQLLILGSLTLFAKWTNDSDDSFNPSCKLKYSKAGYNATDVSSFPAHFEIDKDSPDSDTDSESHKHDIHDNILDTVEGNVHEPYEQKGIGDDQQFDKLSDFTNVYITKPPPVVLRDLNKTWLMLPWRVAQSVEVRQATNH